MNCTAPPALTEIELAMYLAGDAEPAVSQHLVACPACRTQATALAQQEQGLINQLYRSNCPTPAELRDYHLQLSNRADSSNVGLHLARCPHCTRELFDLVTFMDPAPATAPTTLAAQVRLLVASLVDLGGGVSALLGARGDEPTLQLYQVGDVQIGLEIVADPSSGRQQLNGMITGDDLANLLVHLWRGDQLLATAAVDPLLGDFHFTNLPADQPAVEYELIISAQQTKIRLPPIRLA